MARLISILRDSPPGSGGLRRAAIGALLAGVTMAAGSTTSSAQTDADRRIRLEVHSGRASVDVGNALVVDVIRALGEEAGFTTVVHGTLDSRITRSFADIPLEDAVQRLAGGIPLVMIHAPRGHVRTIKEVRLYAPEAAGSPVSRVAPEAMRMDRHLLERLGDENPRARIRAVQQLGRSGEVSVVAAIVPLLSEDDSPAVRRQAAAALGRIGREEAVPALEAALGDSNGSVRIQAVRALGRIGGERAAGVLGDVLLSDGDDRLRRAAAWSLGQLRPELARSYLEAAADDSNEAVRKTAEQTLMRRREPTD